MKKLVLVLAVTACGIANARTADKVLEAGKAATDAIKGGAAATKAGKAYQGIHAGAKATAAAILAESRPSAQDIASFRADLVKAVPALEQPDNAKILAGLVKGFETGVMTRGCLDATDLGTDEYQTFMKIVEPVVDQNTSRKQTVAGLDRIAREVSGDVGAEADKELLAQANELVLRYKSIMGVEAKKAVKALSELSRSCGLAPALGGRAALTQAAGLGLGNN